MPDEGFYVLEGIFGFQVGDRAVEAAAGAFVFAPKGIEHAYWNKGPSPAKRLITIMEVRRTLSEEHDIEVVGPPPGQGAGA